MRREGISRGECYEEGADAMFESLRPWLELAGLMLKDEGDANE
uniref:Uncharacterized protein n=1 Tax=viral metagenome TaxID=1070528 RepID=A0A6M3LW10_9ZZZZ